MSAPEPDSELIEDDVPPPPKPPRFSKRLVVIAGAVLLLILIGGGATAYLLLAGGPAEPSAESHEEEGVTYVDAPAMVVNLRGADGSARFLKIRFTFVPASAAKGELIKAKLPLIVDAFQPFLRELRPEDLAGSAAVFRIKEEMLVRATGAMGPGVVKDILIQDLIQQ
ncbi:flagellar basal body-associated FliL family protein [Sphingomonas sp. RT2P30]|uniref:flagellar basal body-associated FliL family protein n=1 Tax=Parasphingomonas halimpatiens TaxID=3096162 RepID=UPI002FC66D6B